MISSYTPTLSALLSPPHPTFGPDNPPKITVVIQPDTTNSSPLPYTRQELNKIQGHIPEAWLTSFEAPASADEVLQHLHTSSIIHFACHGVQDAEKPLRSALLIGNDRVTISQIIERSAASSSGPHAIDGKNLGLAFLSACETATGDKQVPDEAMHLAATLLFAGYRSVVATMWYVSKFSIYHP